MKHRKEHQNDGRIVVEITFKNGTYDIDLVSKIPEGETPEIYVLSILASALVCFSKEQEFMSRDGLDEMIDTACEVIGWDYDDDADGDGCGDMPFIPLFGGDNDYIN